MACTHQYFKQGKHLTADNALKAMGLGVICWMSQVVKECPDCGMDIEKHSIVEVKTPRQYMAERGFYI